MSNYSRRGFLATSAAASLNAQVVPPSTIRARWITFLERIATPVLRSLSTGNLKAAMPVEAPHGNQADRSQFTHLEAFGRLLSGIAPWLVS